MKRKLLKVAVFRFGRRKFQKRYGKKVGAGAGPCPPNKKECELLIRRDLNPNTYKNVYHHEMGHILTERMRLRKNLDKKEREDLKEFAREVAPSFEKGLRKKKELIPESLAWGYALRTRSAEERRIIDKRFPKTVKAMKAGRKKIKLRTEKIHY